MPPVEAVDDVVATTGIPPLRSGDVLSREEFVRRAEAMGNDIRAERIRGVVVMSPASIKLSEHGEPHFTLTTLLGQYVFATPGVRGSGPATARVDPDSDPEPDLFAFIVPECGGQASEVDGFLDGAPELCIEIANTSVGYDLVTKRDLYEQAGVQEYLVWLTADQRFLALRAIDGRFTAAIDPDGVFRSKSLPGFWLNTSAVLSGQITDASNTLREGLASTEHAAFVERLGQNRAK